MAKAQLAAILGALKVGTSTYVDAHSIGISPQGFHAVVATWVKNNGGPGFEVVGEPQKDKDSGLYTRVRLRRVAGWQSTR